MDRLLLKNASTNSGYPMVGFSFLMGYTCYVNDSVNDEFTGVTTLVDFLQEPMASIIIAEKGLNPLLSTSYAAEIALLHTKLTGVSATPDNSSGVPIYGPSACPAFADNPTNYQ